MRRSARFLVVTLFFLAADVDAKEFSLELFHPALNFHDGQARLLVVPIVSANQMLAGMQNQAALGLLVRQVDNRLGQYAPDKYTVMTRSVDIDYDENLQKTRDKLLLSATGVPYTFTREELSAFSDVDAMLFLSISLDVSDRVGTKNMKATVTETTYVDGKEKKKNKSKKIDVQGVYRNYQYHYQAVLLEPRSTLVFANLKETKRGSDFYANKTYNPAQYGGEIKLPNQYLADIPRMQQSQTQLIDQIAREVVSGIAGSAETVELVWENVKGKAAARAWKALQEGDFEAAQADLQLKLESFLTKEKDRRVKNKGKDKDLRRVYNNMGLVAEVAGDFEAALEFRRMASEVYQKKGGSAKGKKAVQRMNAILAEREAFAGERAMWDTRRTDVLATIAE